MRLRRASSSRELPAQATRLPGRVQIELRASLQLLMQHLPQANDGNVGVGVRLISVQKVTVQPMSNDAGSDGASWASACQAMGFCWSSDSTEGRADPGSISAAGVCFRCSL